MPHNNTIMDWLHSGLIGWLVGWLVGLVERSRSDSEIAHIHSLTSNLTYYHHNSSSTGLMTRDSSMRTLPSIGTPTTESSRREAAIQIGHGSNKGLKYEAQECKQGSCTLPPPPLMDDHMPYTGSK